MSLSTTLKSSSATVIRGAGFKHRQLNSEQRAMLAVAVLKGEQVYQPTLQQACFIFDVSAARLQKHLHKHKNGNGQAPTSVAIEENGNRQNENISDEELVAIVQRAGVGRVWDVMAKLIT
jgi:hypothetical protein